MMLVFWSLLLVAVLGLVESQVNFPTDSPISIVKSINTCTASNGQPGTCYEFRSAEFCSKYIPSLDSSDPDVASHLKKNLCRNTGREIYFCCPEDQRPDVIPGEDVCGKALSFNVVGGERTSAGEWPWLAAIGRKSSTRFAIFCGGTLITRQHVISAAHCFDSQRSTDTIVRLGEYNVNQDGDEALDFQIVDERIGNWNKITKQNDISLLKLDRPVDPFTDSIRPACLPYHLRNYNFEGRNLTVVGWGIYNNNIRATANIPLRGNVPVVPIKECQEKYKDFNSTSKINDSQLCAGTGVTDSCRGDSGGPINYIDLNTARFYVVGLVSFGPTPCGSNNLPGVYTKIGASLDWIEENIREIL